MRPCFEACDACGEPFGSVQFGGRGHVDERLYELCAGCVARMTDLHASAPDGAELTNLTDRVRYAVELRYGMPQGSA